MSTTTDTTHEGTSTPRKRNGKISQTRTVLEPPGSETLDAKHLLRALVAARDGDFSARLPAEWSGISGRIADAFNDILASNETMAKELDRVSRVVGKEGKIQQRANFKGAGGAWRGVEDSINTLIADLVWPTTEVTRTIGAIAKGDLTQTMTLEVDGRPLEGEFLRSARIVNSMIGQ